MSSFEWKRAFGKDSALIQSVENNDALMDLFNQIDEEISKMNSYDANHITDISICVDNLSDNLSNLWEDSELTEIDQKTFVRMTMLMDKVIINTIDRIFDQLEIVSMKKGILKKIRSFVQSYIQSIERVTSPNTHTSKPWNMDKYTPKQMYALDTLIAKFKDEVVRIINDLSGLLDADEQDALHFSSIVNSASSLIPTKMLSNPNRIWEAQYKLFASRLVQAEKCAASKLHTQLMDSASSPEVILQIFKDHSALLTRPSAIQELGHEFSQASNYISTRAQKILNDIGKKRSNDTPVNNLIWYQQKKVIIQGYMKFVSSLPDSGSLSSELNTINDELKNFSQNMWNLWVSQIKTRLSSSLRVPEDGSLVDFGANTGGNLEVKFTDDLFQFLQEANQLQAVKITLPPKISELVQRAEPLYKQALVMQRVSMFYNNMADRIIKYQRPMLLQPATEFEKLVKSVKSLNSTSAPKMLSALQLSLSNIMSQNSQISAENTTIQKKIKELFDVDLIDKRHKWTQSVQEMRQIVKSCVEKGFQNSQFWTLHLDSQIYKALRYQLRSSLLSISERTAQIDVSLIFADGRTQFRPTIQEVRRMYYQNVSDIFAFPRTFKGISNDSSFFAPISAQASDVILYVYEKGETNIRKFIEHQNSFKEWEVLAQNMDEAQKRCETIIELASDWKSNINLIPTRKESINKIEDTTVIGCFKIDNTQAKEGFRRLVSQFQSTLFVALRKTLRDEFERVENFVKDGMSLVTGNFDTAEAIAESRSKFTELARNKVDTEMAFTSLEEKVNLLKMRESIDEETTEFNKLRQQWKELTEKMESFDANVASQFENVKNKMRDEFAQLKIEIHNFKLRWDEMKPHDVDMDDDSVVVSIPQTLKQFNEQAQQLHEKYDKLAKPLADFDENVQIEELEEFDKEFKQQEQAIELLIEWRDTYTEIASQKWSEASAKLFHVEDFLNQWSQKITQLEYTSDAALYIDEKVKHYKSVYPFLKYARGDDWTDQHWAVFFRMVSLPPNQTAQDLLLGDIIEVGDQIQSNIKQIKELAERARGENTIRTSLEEVRSWFSTTNFQWFEHTFAQRTTYIVQGWKQILSDLADKQSLIGSLKDSQYVKAFQSDVDLWDKKSVALSTSLRLLNEIQRRWLHLEPVFVKKALPEHQDSFEVVDKEFRDIMRRLKDANRAAAAADLNPDQLEKILQKLDALNRVLNVFLEHKRDNFSRFYFIGDEDLLEIIGQASEDATIIQAHLKKLFQGVHSVVFDGSNTKIIAVCSSLGERVDLKNPIICQGPVEEWLMTLSNEVSDTLKSILAEMIKTKPNKDYFKYPSQLTLLYHQIRFTAMVEKVKDVDKLSKYVEDTLMDLVSCDTQDELQRYTARSLIIEFVRFRQVVDDLRNPGMWNWKKQLRFYFRSGICFAEMGDGVIPYGYEYQGNPQRLVYTNLTAKCYLTLCEGISLGYGGNPYGPAGTGKTESVKALGQALGRQVLVFNCDEAIDVQSMCRIFTGLVMGGAWGCFDEFNRLDEEVLSALSQQIQVIQTAILNKASNVELLGRNINVNPNAGIYVTLNPAGKGYGGRSKLPSNLTALFRAVAMSAPDNELIAEVLMYSQGFKCARALSKQIVLVFALCKQLLSPEIHYDWGLRSLKSILSTAEQWMNNMEGDVDEPALLVKALRVSTLSKLTFADRVAFEQIISDVFPNVQINKVEEFELRTAASEVIKEMKIVELPHQVDKMLQMWESINQRTGVVLTGPSGCGKTTLWTLLQKTLDKIGVKVDIEVMNPKSMPRQRLLGRVDYDTREWFDGVLTRAARRAVASSNRTWIVCDGDIDPEWIESLNSVLDDNRLLTLPNGERIQFDSKVNFVFESHSLEHASPATVSRMAVILLAPEDLTVENVCTAWVSKWPKDSRVPYLMEQLFYRTIEALVKKSNSFVIGSTTFGLTTTVLSHLNLISGNSDSEFINALIRGSVCILPPQEQPAFAADIYKWSNQLGLSTTGIDPANILDQYWNGSSLQLFDFHPAPPTVPAIDSSSLPLVSTTEVQRTIHTIKNWIESGQPMMLVGPRGSGKTTVLTHLFKLLPSTTIIVLNCSAQTDAASLMTKLMQQCTIASTASGQVLRPRNTEKALVFFKNFDLPRPDKWGTVQLVSFMQQILTHGGFYNEELQWITLERIQFVFSMSSAEKRPISPRFTSIIRIAAMHNTEASQLQVIYSHYLSEILKKTDYNDNSKVQAVAAAMVRVFQKFSTGFSIDEYPHYDFTYRDITRWVVQLQRYIHNSNTFTPNIIIYEGIKHFANRLSSLSDRTRMIKEIKQIFRDNLPIFEETDFEYCNYQIDTNDKAPLYLVQMERQTAQEAFQKLIVSYEREMGHLDIFRMQDTEWLANVLTATIAMPSSNVVAITVPGLFFTEILRVICHSSGIEIYSPPMLADFSNNTFMAFLKDLIPKVTGKDEEVVLLMEDFMFVDNAILDALNSLMASGEVGGLFSQTEFDSLVASIQGELRESNTNMTPQEFYCAKVRRLIHVVIVLNPEHSAFRSFFNFAPSFVSDASIIWATELSQQSLMTIPRQILLQEGDDSALNSDNLSKLNPMFASTFQAVKEAPIKYSEFLRLYLNLFNKKQKELAEKKGRLDIGLAKLNEAAKTVDTLSGEIQAKKTVLSGKEKDANDAMERIKKAVAECSSQQTKIEKMQGTLSEEEKNLQSEQTKIEAELGTIQPEIDAALEAVGKIRREHLAEVRALAKPPQAISEVMSGVLMMLGENELSWASIKKIMGSDNFTNRIMKFDAKSLTPEIINNVARHLKQKGMFFEDATIRKASQAVAPLAQWVKANVRFFSVLEKVEPLRKKNEQYASEIQKKRLTLKELQDKKAKVDKQVAEFQEQFRITTKEAQQLKNEVSLAEQNLHDAEQLFSKLKDERTRWDTQRNQISAMLTSLPKEVLLAAAVGTFCGPFPEDERKKMVSLWLPIAKQAPDATFNMGKFMYTESELMALRGSLSGDALSLENAVIITNSVTVPLIIDPTNKALDWLVNNIQKRGGQATVLPRGHERFSSELALAVRFGKTLIITEIDSIDAILIPLIRKDLIFSGSRPAIKVGDREIDYNEKFTLYLLTREPQPQLHPTAAAHVAVVNFSVTRAGLESTLLSLTLEREQPEIQAERSKYIANEEEMKATLSDLEVTLLKTLVEADSGNILQNTSLIETLNKTKEQAAAVAESLEKIESLSKKLEEKANTYRSLAQLGASLFFAIDGLSKLDHMYRFSSTLFMTLFTSIFDAKVNANGVHRTLKFESELVRIIFRHVSNSMFNKYRTAAALHIVASCYKNLVDATQYQFLINSPVSTGDAPSWVPETRKQAFCGFAKAMPELVQTLKMRDPTAGDVWADWLKQSHPEENLPIIDGQQVSKRGLTPFAQLLIVGMLVPHRLVAAIQAFVTEALGLGQFSAPFEYNQIVSDKTGLPMIFITSPGADPSHEVVSVAKRANVSLTEVAVGSDTPDATVAKLKKCAEEGTWFMLKNTHLSISLVARLEKEIASLQTKKEGFRVFFTTEPHRSFPPLLLANSIKVAVEAPPGVKANLTRTIAQIDTKSMQPQQLKLAAAVAYFHSIIQERRTYIPQGWTKFYEFSTADFSCAMQIIQKTKEADAETLEYIRGLLCLAVYGGRVDNDFDFNVLSLYLQEFLNEKKNPLRLENNAQISNVMKFIEKMNERDDPSLFMLPPNATKTVAMSQMNETITSLRKLSSIVSDSGSISRAQWIDKFTPLLQRWQDLRRKYPNMTVQRQNSPFDDTPMAAALYSQCCVIHQLVDDLEEYFKMVDGFLNHGDTLSHQLQSLGRSLIAGEVPDAWSDVAEGPSVASEWLQEVARKVEYIDALAADPSMVSKGIELGAVLRPTALLDALRQQTARETGTPMVDLKLTFSFSESKERAIYVTDLALQGAVFQGLKIAPMTKDEQVLVKCSKCSFSWEKERKNDGIAMIPLYSNSNREKFIVTVPAPCSEITSKDASKVFSFAGTAFIIGSN